MRKRLRNRRAGKRRNYRGPVPRTVTPAGMLSVAKTFVLGTISPTSTPAGVAGEGRGNAQFSLSQVGDLLTLAPNFDQYRICAAQIKIVPTSSEALAGGSNNLGVIYTYIDHTDANAPANIAEVLDRQKYKLHRADRVWSEYIKSPRTASPVYNGAVVSGYEINKANQWMSTSNTGVPHYGWKWYCSGMQNQLANVYIKLYVQFKDPV